MRTKIWMISLLAVGCTNSTPVGSSAGDESSGGEESTDSTTMVTSDTATTDDGSSSSTGEPSDGSSSSTSGETAADSSSGGGDMCGDGVVSEGEECDLGDDNSDDGACTTACLQATCGDGLVQAGVEDCDVTMETADCDADCTAAECGDGTVNATAGEECEADGTGFACDACLVSCTEGLANCNDDLVDGCETDLLDPATCGDCGAVCEASQVCTAEGCVEPTFLVSERNASTVWVWNPASGTTEVFHNAQLNDADCNAAEGSNLGWAVEHNNDNFFSFVPGDVTNPSTMVSFAYPKHVTVFNDELVVMSRNDATIVRFSLTDGSLIASHPTGNGTGQGMATDGESLWVSFWDIDASESFFVRYDASFVAQETIANPTGMGTNTNVVDFAYLGGGFYGLATDFEEGTNTETTTVIAFTMGGAVTQTLTLPFNADGIGQSECL